MSKNANWLVNLRNRFRFLSPLANCAIPKAARPRSRSFRIEHLEERAMMSVSPGLDPDVMQVGTNIEGVYDWMAGWTFTDIQKHSRDWIAHEYNTETGEFSWHSDRAVNTDDHGWATSLDSWTNEEGQVIQQTIGTLMALGEAGQFPSGIYRAEWDGNASVEWEFDVVNVVEEGTTAEGRNYALLNVTPDGGGIHMHIFDIDAVDPIRNVNVWMPDYNGQSFVGQGDWTPESDVSPFHPLFVDRLSDFGTLRLMQFLGTNDTTTVEWSERRELTDARQVQLDSTTQGAAIEYGVELANQLDADPWVNVPHTANDDYVRNFATLVRDTLDPELKVYVEWSNELWNFAPEYPAFHWITDQLALPENEGVDRWEFAAGHIQRDFEIWSEVFAGQEDRLVRVVAGQSGNPWITEQLLSHLDGGFDAVAVGGYFAPDYEERLTFTAETTPDEIIEVSMDSIATTLGQVAEHREMLEEYEASLGRDLELLVYEGGPHFDGRGATYQSAIVEAISDPRIYDAERLLLNGMNDVGVDRFMDYQYTQRVAESPWGNFGSLHHQDQSIEDAHKYRALTDAIHTGFNPDNVRPTVSDTADELMSAGSTATIELTVSDAETAASDLIVIADASESALFPNANIEITGSGVDRTMTLTPAEGQTGYAMISVLVADADGGTALDTFYVEVRPDVVIDPPEEDLIPIDENQAPTAFDGSFSGFEDDDVWAFLPELVEDAETPWDGLTFAVGAASNGSVELYEGRSAVFTPDADYFGAASFAFTVTDEGGLSSTGLVSLDILPVNDAPTAGHFTLSTVEDVAVEFDLHALASDIDNSFEELTIRFVENWLGEIEILADGSNARFTPNPDSNGHEDLWFSVTDPGGLESWNYIDLVVEAVNDAPVAHSLALTTMEDQPLWIELGELASDAETPLQELAFTFHDVHGGEVEQIDEYSALFTPAADFNGDAHFLFTVSDQGEPVLSKTGEVVIHVSAVNDAPNAAAGSLWVGQGSAFEFDLYDFVIDVDTPSSQLSFEVFAGCEGTAELLADGHTVRFTPETTQSNDAEIWFHVSDEDEDDWGNITLEFESMCAVDACFAELGNCA